MTSTTPIESRRPRHAPSPRAATVLSYLMPGLGHAYAGDVRRGAGIWAAMFALFLVALVVWVTGPHVYVPDTLVWVFIYLTFGASVARGAADAARGQCDTPLTRRPLHHPLALCGVWLGMGLFPICASIWYVEANHVGSVEIRGYGMFPQLLPGDRIFFDRKAFLDARPSPGELVVVGDGPAQTVVRVVAVGGDRVSVRGGLPTVNGDSLARYPVVDLHVPRFGVDEQDRLSIKRGYVESNAGRAYLVVEARAAAGDADPAPVVLARDELYVLGDDRTAAVAEGLAGRVRLGALRGRPELIWRSHRQDGSERAGRRGTPVQ